MQSDMSRTAFLLYAAAIGGCTAPADPVIAGDPGGVYSYLADLGDSPVVEGTMTFQVAADSTVTGTWELHRVPVSDTTLVVGPQTGSGTIAGRRTATGVWLDLNPGWADNNVFLALIPETTGGLSGTWDYSTLIGPVSGGAVRLLRLER